MKRSLSFLIALVMLLSLALPASAAGNVVITFDGEELLKYFSGAHNLGVSYSAEENALQLSANGSIDPYVYFNIGKVADISANTYKYAVVTYRTPKSTTSNSGITQLFWIVGGQAICEANSTRFSHVRSDSFRAQVIDLSGASYWRGQLTQMRLDPYSNGKNTMYIQSIAFCQTRQAADQTAEEQTALANTPREVPLNVKVCADQVFAANGKTNLAKVGGNDPAGTMLGKIDTDSVILFGWLAASVKIQQFGYRYGDEVVLGSPKASTETAVKNAGASVAGSTGESSRFRITVPVRAGSDVEVFAVAQLSTGAVIDLWRVIYSNGELPVEEQPVETPPVETPPEETPPVETPPVEDPPAEDPPEEKPGITVTGEKARVVTESGLIYTAAGYSAVTDKAFQFGSGFTMTLEDAIFAPFNRMSFTYTATEPLKMTIVYLQNGKTVTDGFYLESGTDKVFSGLILGYPDGASATEIRSIQLSSCNGKSATFYLSGIATGTCQVFTDGIYYLENSRFKLGLNLDWGGGISYLQDKTHVEAGLTNLINNYDTGRLIQQSYYGASYGTSGYTGGVFSGTKWPYNPVQGGDQYDNASRLIDLVISGDTVYLKTQPRDWAQNGVFTPSYMENVYTLFADHIQVDNRFVDYSGYTNSYRDQEVPALYTVSYLDNFTYYSGSQPWTGGALTTKSNLNFWGDSKYSSDCRFPITSGNTETWCAWTSRSSGFGIGLFVPGVDKFVAGRYKYNASKSPSASATNYVAPLKMMAIQSYEPMEYTYLLTTGTVAEIRSTFTANRALSGEMKTIDLSVPSAAALFNGFHNTTSSYSSTQKATCLKVTSPNDVYAYLDLEAMGLKLQAEDYGTLSFQYMIPANSSRKTFSCELFLCTGDNPYAVAGKSVWLSLTADGQYHTASVNVGSLSFWSGAIHKIRVDYFNSCRSNDQIYLRNLSLTEAPKNFR